MGILIALPLFLIGMVFVLFERKLRVAREWLLKGCDHLLAKSQQSGNDEYTVVKYVIACLVILLFSIGLLYGEGVNLALLLPHINGTGSGVSGAEIDQGSIWLYLFVPAFLGMLWFEFRGIPIFGLRLFPQMDAKLKKRLCFVTLLALILACIVFVLLWVYRALALAHPKELAHPTQDLTSLPFGMSFSFADVQLFLFIFMGLVAAYTLIFAMIGLKVGLIGLSVLVLGVLIVVSAVLEFFPCHVVAQLLSYPCLFLTQGKLTPYKTLTELQEVFQQQQRQAEQERIDPYHTQLPEGEEETVKKEKIHAAIFAGDDGVDLFRYVAEEVEKMFGAQETILASGVLILDKPERLALPGTHSVTPTREELEHVRKISTARKDEDKKAQVYRPLCNIMTKKLVDLYTREGLKHVSVSLLFFLDVRVLLYAEEMLRTVAQKLPDAQLAVVTAVTADDVRRENVRAVKECCEELWRDGVLATTLVFNPLDCPFRQNRQDRSTLSRFLSRAIVSLLVAKKQYWDNLTSTEVFKRLSERSAFTTVSFASSPASAGALPFRYWFTKFWLGKRGEKGVCDVASTIETTKELIRRVYDSHDPGHESTRSLQAPPVNWRVPSFIVCNEPISPREDEKLEQVRRELDSFTGKEFIAATVLLSCSRGVPYGDDLPAPYLVGANCFYNIYQEDFSAEQAIEAGEGTTALPEAKRFADQHEDAGMEEEQHLAPFTVGSESRGQRGNGAGNGQGGLGKGTAKQHAKPSAAKRGQSQGQQKQAGAGKKDTVQAPSTANKRGRKPKQPVEEGR